MDIFLVRHTEYDNPDHIFPYHLPVTLSTVGRRKAVNIGKWFVEHTLSSLPIIVSPVKRTIETAEIIASITNSTISVDEDLIEVHSVLQGKPMPKANDWSMCYKPGVQENPALIIARMKRAFDKAVGENRDCIIISHGDPLTLLYYDLLKKEPPQTLDSATDYVEKGDIIQISIDKLSQNKLSFNRYRIE